MRKQEKVAGKTTCFSVSNCLGTFYSMVKALVTIIKFHKYLKYVCYHQSNVHY